MPWTGDTSQITDDILLVRTGGHFAGGTVLHWRSAAQGQGGALTQNILISKGAGAIAAAFAAVNIFGGFLVTQRMLAMYRKKERPPPKDGGK